MPRILGWILTLVVAGLLVAGALVIGKGGTGTNDAKAATDAKARAADVCVDAQKALAQLPKSPTSFAAAVRLEDAVLVIFRQEVSRLERLTPPHGGAFRSGLAADRALLEGLSSMLLRPDYEKLALTISGHPERAPHWMKLWLAREHRLLDKARAAFARADIPACRKSVG